MNKILHVLNGDVTAEVFKRTGLEGDVVIWREVLSEGPLLKDITSAEFWLRRKEWICRTFNDTEENYTHTVIDEIARLNAGYNEINLWFEFDMHCQINLLGVLMLLKQQVDLSEPKIYLISPDDYPEVTNFRGMGQLNADQLEDLYDGRLGVSPADIYAAENSWDLLVNNDAQALLRWADTNKYWGSLYWLRDALLTHIKRRTVNPNGLNSVQQALWDIYQTGVDNKKQLYEIFWNNYPIYGMGDKELDIYLESLKQHYPINVI